MKIRTVYKYDKETKEYIGTANEMYDDSHPEYFAPIEYSTHLPPKSNLPEYKVNVFDTKYNIWIEDNDFRGTWYKADNQNKKVITKIGDTIVNPGKDYTKVPPMSSEEVWNGKEWVIPEDKQIEHKKENAKALRNTYLAKYVDTRTVVLHWEELDEIERGKTREYRSYLLNYPTSSEKWYENDPKTWDEYFDTNLQEEG